MNIILMNTDTNVRLIIVFNNFDFLFHRDSTGKFPDFPDEDEGGSAIIFKQKSPDELEKELKEKVGTFMTNFFV